MPPPITIMPPVTSASRTSAPPPAAFGSVGGGVSKRPSPSAPPAGIVNPHPRSGGQVHSGTEVNSSYTAARFPHPPSYEEIIKNPVGSISKAKAALVCGVCSSSVVYSLEPEPPELVICPHCNEATVVTPPKDKQYLRCPAPCSCLIAYETGATNVLCPRCNRVLDAPPPVTHVGLIPQARQHQQQPAAAAASTPAHSTIPASERRPLTERMHVDDTGGKRNSSINAVGGAAVQIRRPSDAGSVASSNVFAGVKPVIFLFLGIATLLVGIGLFVGLAVAGTFSSSPLWIIMPSGLVVIGLFLLAIYFVLNYCL